MTNPATTSLLDRANLDRDAVRKARRDKFLAMGRLPARPAG